LYIFFAIKCIIDAERLELLLALIRENIGKVTSVASKWYLVDGEHLSIGLLHLLELPEEVPAHKHNQIEQSANAHGLRTSARRRR
jgi:hypothetical protein